MKRVLLVVASAAILAGCSSEAAPTAQNQTLTTASSAPSSTVSTNSVAKQIKAKVPQAAKVVEITEDNDGNNLIGRPNGYSQATVIVDSRAKCGVKPGVDCGVMLELWPSEAAAKKRKDYIQSILERSPILGSEYDTVKDSMLLRVSGELKPSVAQTYAAAFEGSGS